MRNKFLFLILGYLLFSCGFNKSYINSNSSSLVDEVIVYWVPQYSTRLIRLDCDKIKEKYKSKIHVTNKDEINQLYNYINTIDNDKTLEYDAIDSRVLLEFILNGKIISRVCWQNNVIEINGKVYSCKKNKCYVEKFLFDNNVIMRIEN